MAESLQTGQSRPSQLIRAAQIAIDTPARQSANGVSFATFGETGVADLDLDRILEAVPTSITASLGANTYYFVPLALRETAESPEALISENLISETPLSGTAITKQPVLVARAYSDELSDSAICHRNVELPHGQRGVFISTKLLGDRFTLSFEFFINVAHAFTDVAGVPAAFADLAWQQALDNVRGETSLDAWEFRNLAFGRPANHHPELLQATTRRNRTVPARQRDFAAPAQSLSTTHVLQQPIVDEKERKAYLDAAFADAIAIYLLSLALDFDYSELREREYPLLAPGALAARLRLVAALYPPNPNYEFAVRYRRRA
jgi:hypothetical protein